MARRGRAYPVKPRTLLVGSGFPLDSPPVELGAFVTTSTFPAMQVVVPDANVTLPAFVTTSSFPSLTVGAGFSSEISLPVFVTTSSFPRLVVDVPLVPGARMTGVDGEVQFEDELWTPGGLYSPQGLEGWDDTPPLTMGDADKPQADGAWPGISLAEARNVALSIWVRDDSPTWAASLARLRRVTRPRRDETEYPLVVRTRGETWMAWARIRNRIVPEDLIGVGTSEVAVQWVCADPRRYGPVEHRRVIAAGQTVGIANDGDAPTSPTLVIPGPAVRPRMTTPDMSLAFNVELLDGQTLTVDTRLGTVEWSTGDYAPVDDFSVPVEEWQIPMDGADVLYEPESGGDNGIEIIWRYATW